jgi:hypothetical protein
MNARLSKQQVDEIQRQVGQFFGGDSAYRQLSPAQQDEIREDTAKVLRVMIEDSPEVGLDQAAGMVKQVDFPAFVAGLIQGTFRAIVNSSIEQMKAYADMVKSVSASIDDFKDKNTTENKSRDHLARKYPQLLATTILMGINRIIVTDGKVNFKSETFPLEKMIDNGAEQDRTEPDQGAAKRDGKP